MTCRKIRYYTRLSAKIALASTQRSDSPRREEKRIYWCQQCHAFHLTSKK